MVIILLPNERMIWQGQGELKYTIRGIAPKTPKFKSTGMIYITNLRLGLETKNGIFLEIARNELYAYRINKGLFSKELSIDFTRDNKQVVASIKSKEFDELEKAFKQFLGVTPLKPQELNYGGSRGITPSTSIYYTTNRLKIIGIGIIIVVIIVGVIYSTNTKVTNILTKLIPKTARDFLPNKQDIADWQISQTEEIKVNYNGFLDGIEQKYVKRVPRVPLREYHVMVQIYRFNNFNNAFKYYNSIIDKFKEELGKNTRSYEVIPISKECFGVYYENTHTFLNPKITKVHCNKENIVFLVESDGPNNSTNRDIEDNALLFTRLIDNKINDTNK